MTATSPPIRCHLQRGAEKEAFQAQGFGLLTEIDMQATFKKKLDRDIERYAILGVRKRRASRHTRRCVHSSAPAAAATASSRPIPVNHAVISRRWTS
jgi:hypothetical protein